METVKSNAREIRDKVLKYLMVRRTRRDIENYFPKDIEKRGLKFPEVEKPQALFYEFNDNEEAVFNETIKLLATRLRYARYMPMLYYKGKVDQLEKQSQRNLGRFMKVLLVKRLESSFFAFRKTVSRFLSSYEMFINEYDRGHVYFSKDHINKVFALLEDDDDEAVQKLIDEGKAEKYESDEFEPGLRRDLEHDRDILLEIKKLWEKIDRDPKLIKFKNELAENPTLKDNHIVIFTESGETAQYLAENLDFQYTDKVLLFTGHSSESVRDKVINNFDARARNKRNDFRILVSTEVLSEGVNLHRANVVVNYDIPWNPTRMMQRVGRINRVDTPFDVIHTFNFFPTRQSNDQIKLKEAAEAKINAFFTLLGGDAELLTEGEPIDSHELFDRLLSKYAGDGENGDEESELKYLREIEDVRDENPELFEKIKRLPKKARSGKKAGEADHIELPANGGETPAAASLSDSLLTYFRRGKVEKFFLAAESQEPRELDFMTAAAVLKSDQDQKKEKIPPAIYDLLDENKKAFEHATNEEISQPARKKGGRDSAAEIQRILKATLKNTRPLTDDQEDYMRRVLERIEEGALPKQTAKKALKAIKSLNADMIDPLKVFSALKTTVSDQLLESHYAGERKTGSGKREVILSLYLCK